MLVCVSYQEFLPKVVPLPRTAEAVQSWTLMSDALKRKDSSWLRTSKQHCARFFRRVKRPGLWVNSQILQSTSIWDMITSRNFWL